MNLKALLSNISYSQLVVITVIVATVAIIAVILQPLFQRKYKALPFLLTKAEANFFRQLLQMLPKNNHINCKVRLADLCTPRRSKDIRSFNQIAKKHIDFVITDTSTGKVLCCIELDDSSHFSFSAQKRDKIKNLALEQASIALIRVRNSRSYRDKISQDILPLLARKPREL